MVIVDAQVHLWRNSLPSNPNHRQIPNFTEADLLTEMDEAGVDAALIHPPGWDPSSNELVIEAAKNHPNRLAVLGNFPLDQSPNPELVKAWKRQPGILGLRWALNQPQHLAWT